MNTFVNFIVIVSMMINVLSPTSMNRNSQISFSTDAGSVQQDQELLFSETDPTPFPTDGIVYETPVMDEEPPSTPTPTFTLEPSPTVTPTLEEVLSQTPEPKITETPNATPTLSPTITSTPADAVTESPTPTPTEVPTITPTVPSEKIKDGTEENFRVEKKGGKVTGLNNRIGVEFPEGALEEDINLKIRKLDPEKEEQIQGGSSAFEITADGMTSKQDVEIFNKDIIIEVHYFESDIPGNENSLSLFYYDEDEQSWVVMPSWVDAEVNILYARSNHLSVFNYKIHDMQISKLPSMDRYQVSSFTGAATYSYDFQLPPGPGGFQPSLTLSYNSQIVDDATESTQANWVGMGWSLETGQITRNMNGTGDYLGDDTFTLTIGNYSSMLIPVPDSSNPSNNSYYRTMDDNFWRVQHNGTFDASIYDTWTAWDKEGNVYYFGEWYLRGMIENPNLGLEYTIPIRNVNASYVTSNALYPTYNFENCSDYFKGYQNYVWPLTRINNKSDKSIQFVYYYDVKVTQPASECDSQQRDFVTAVYPQVVVYPNQRYRIHFFLSNRSDYYSSWNSLSARTPYQKRRISLLKVEHDTNGDSIYDQIVRRYTFTFSTTSNNLIFPDYTWNSGGKTLTLSNIQEAGLNESATLPPTDFYYGDKMHLTRATNGYGGEISFTYESTPWYPDNAGVSRARNDRFGYDPNVANPLCTPPGYSKGYWSADTSVPGSTVVCDGSHLSVVGQARRYFSTTYDGGFLRPGGAYQIFADVVGTNIQIGIKNQNITIFTPDRFVPGLGPVFILPNNSNKVEVIVKCDSCYLQNNFSVRFLLTRYRVIEKKLKDDITKKEYVYGYDYLSASDRVQPDESLRNAKPDLVNTITNVCPAVNPYVDSSYCFYEAYSQFWGHNKVTITNPDNSVVVTQFSQNFGSLGRTKEVHYKSSSTGSSLLMDLFTFSTVEQPANRIVAVFPHRDNKGLFADLKIYWNKLTVQEHRIYNSNSVDYNFNKQDLVYSTDYGNITSITEYYGAFLNNVQTTTPYRFTELAYSPNNVVNGVYLVGLPKYQKVFKCSTSGCSTTYTDQINSTLYLYDGSSDYNSTPSQGFLTGSRTLIRYDSGAPKYLDQDYGYDAWGNLVTTKVYTNEGTSSSRATSTVQVTTKCFGSYSGSPYSPVCNEDGYSTYLAWIRDARGGPVTRLVYDKALSVLTSETDPNNSVTTADYDTFGRVIEVRRPGDSSGASTISISYDDWAYTNTQTLEEKAAFRVDLIQKITDSNSHAIRRFYDGLGRLIQQQTVSATISDGVELKDIAVDYAYDANGNIIEESAPYTMNAWSYSTDLPTPYRGQQHLHATTTAYDSLGRPVQVNYPDTRRMSISYNGLATTVTDANANTTSSTKDVWGRTVQVSPSGGLTTGYEYDRSGNLTKITQAGLITTINYDFLGRKTSMVDPDMGTWYYTYDALGNLVRQRDAKNQRTCLYYDSLNRLVSKHYRTDDSCPSSSGSVASRGVVYGFDGDIWNTYFDESSLTSDWEIGAGNVSFSGGQATISGTGSGKLQRASATVSNLDTTTDGKQVRFSFQLSSATAANAILVKNGDYTTSNYRRWGLETASDGYFYVVYYEGVNRYTSQLMQAKPNTWYEGVLQMRGTYSARVWERDNPSVSSGWNTTLTNNWDARQWLFVAMVTTSGATLKLDSYQEQKVNQYGYRTWMKDPSGQTRFYFDGRGRLTSQTKVVDGIGSFNTQWSYYSNDAVFTMKYPGNATGGNGETLTFSYNNQELLSSVLNNNSSPLYYVSGASYDESGRLLLLKGHINQTLRQAEYYPWDENNTGGWLRNLSWPGLNSEQNQLYEYDKNGNILSYDNKEGSSYFVQQDYTYDSLNRLKSTSGTINGTGFNMSYSYDTLGRLSSKEGITLNYAHNNHPHAVSSTSSGTSYTYDSNGNMTTRGAYNYTYDSENRMTGVSGLQTASFVYDGDGNRVKATVGGVTITYIGNYFEWTGSTSTMKKYYYAGSLCIAMRVGINLTATGLTWLFSDHLGSVIRTQSASSSTVYTNRTYKPWGEQSSGTNPTTRGYTGQIEEPNLGGIYFYNARWYDPAVSRFMSADSIIPDLYNPQSWDRYSYGLNNPSRYTDPTGHWTEDELNDALGEDWREKFFGKDGVFYGREKLLEFLVSKNTTSAITLDIVRSLFNTADLAHGLGADFSGIDAMGARVSISGGSVGFGGISGDIVLNLTSGEFSLFASPEGGVVLGATATLVGGVTLIKNLPNNDGYRGVAKSIGLMGGDIVGLNVEKNWGGIKYFQDSRDVLDGTSIGVGGAVPGVGVYGSLSYSFEVLRVDQAGSQWWLHQPSIGEVLSDLGEVIQHDLLNVH